MKQYKVMDGNEACSYVSYLFSEIAGIYPITPASTMAEKVDELSSKGFNNLYGTPVKVMEMQSEAGAIALVHGALQSGVLATTYTASQGLLLMIPSMYKIAGECLPCVINVAARSIATHALSILGDHQDIYAVRPTGFAMIASSSVQDVMNLTAVSYLSSIDNSMPVVNFFDGFRTSHELKKIEVLDGKDLKYLINRKALEDFRNNSLIAKKQIRGTTENDDIYFQNTEARNENYDKMPDVVNTYMQRINEITGKDYKPFNYYGDKNASKVIVAMGSVCDTIKEVIDNEEDLGLIEVHLYRPFSKKYFMDVMPKTVKKIAVLDRTKEAGSIGEPLYLDVCSIFQDEKQRPLIIGGRYGLSSKNTDAAQVKAVYDFLDDPNCFTSFTVGITDDLTHKSIPVNDYKIKHKGQREILIYGYGSDGMVTASKDIITILGNYTNAYVQGYFQYDSKKSGGVTKSHLRVSKDDIRSSYYIDKANLLVCTKDKYLLKYDIVRSIKKGGIFIISSSLSNEDLIKLIPNNVKKELIDKEVKTYVIDAFKIAEENNIPNKISAIMETAIFKLANLVNYEAVKEKIKDQIIKKFSKKGKEIVDANLNAIKSVDDSLRELDINMTSLTSKDDEKPDLMEDKILKYASRLKGDELTVKDFIKHKDGSFAPGTSKLEKRDIAEMLPCWNKDNCIQCNMCALACPHAVIRPFVLTEDEVKKFDLEGKVKKVTGKDDLYFYMAISKEDCTGCGVCSEVCPAKEKAITMMEAAKSDRKNVSMIFEMVKNKNIAPKNTIKGSQFEKPLFEFSGACAGCGETPYLKLLTQLFGESLVIANATGCSSIYGGSHPSMSYSVSWANSLFEDNAEFGLGIETGDLYQKEKIKNILQNSNLSDENKEIADNWINNPDDIDACERMLKYFDFSESLKAERLKKYIMPKTTWIIGGDGWAYDIGYGGLDHVLASGENVNILVLDTEVYSNTGGQKSKATRSGATAKFASSGKKGKKKDLARMAMAYDDVYVASVSLGANMQQTIKAFTEAKENKGPSIIIAYAPCINHGIKSGMKNSIKEEKLAVESGYWPLFRYKPSDEKLYLDFKNPNFDKYEEFLDNENRYTMTKLVNENRAKELFQINKENAIKRFNFYKELSEKE
ncbi:MAG TPA: pyruvate:ferredoxin (flavodoxin) oxidoreductase [Candidatus Aphodocola excrementigallinarum]|uniref:Pyruvate:ferredoxin (Flavodoxin) oxidoreductase n=1 Tax=Candidatus Aphodocola excrementigallinarum TaxID=2840670 RepID=A0A9D1LH81_9FIRM|nr:pyruvate:ferredoxin (flavodoxin) oxidoreductase [Candidatus Aphodocola excrementigallinarum]